jgi:hypothetical protein
MIPKVRKMDANAGACKGASALNMVSKVLQIADLIMDGSVYEHCPAVKFA